MMAVLAERQKIEMPSKLSIDDYFEGGGSDALESSSSSSSSSRSQGDFDSGVVVKMTHSQKVSSQKLQPLSLNISQIDPKQYETTTTTTTTTNNSTSSPLSNSEELNNKISKKVVEQSNLSPTSVLRKRLLVSSSDREKDVDLGMPHNTTTSDSTKVVVPSDNSDQTNDGLSSTTTRSRSSIIYVSVGDKEARRRRPSKRVSFHSATKPANHQAKCSSTSSSSNVDEIDLFAPGTTSHLNSARRRMQQIDRQQKQQRQQHLFFPIFVLLFVILLEVFIFLSKSPAQHIRHYDGNKKNSQMSSRQPPSSSYSPVQL